MSVNKVILIGNLGKDPEIRYTSEGKHVSSFSIATSESWAGQDGQKKEITEWHNISAFGKLAEICGQYLKKGSQVFIEGKIKTEKWTDKAGVERYTTKIIANEMKMLGSKPGSGSFEVVDDKPRGDFSDMEDDVPF